MKAKITFTLLTIMIAGLIGSAFTKGKNTGVAKVIVMRGKVIAKSSELGLVQVKKGMWLPEGAILRTAPKSFAKLLFIDKSQMNLGPDSQMVINEFPKKKAGIITLMKGQLRSKVTKNYLEMDDKSKSKLYIKTKTAAMGVRGTDFQVNYNLENNNTSLVTFSGAVAMAPIGAIRELAQSNVTAVQNRLEKVISSNAAVLVKKGEFSAVSPKLLKAPTPAKVLPSQLESLKRNDGSKGLDESSNSPQASKKYRSPVPPGVDVKKFANEVKETEGQLEKVVDKDVSLQSKVDLNAPDAKNGNTANGPKEPMVVMIVPGQADAIPVQETAIDPITGVAIGATEIQFDPATGEPILTQEPVTATGDLTRDPASIDGNATNEPTAGNPVKFQTMTNMAEKAAFDPALFNNAIEIMGADGTMNAAIAADVDEVMFETNQQIQNNLDQPLVDGTTRANFDIISVD